MAIEYRVEDYVTLGGPNVGAELRALTAMISASYAADPGPRRVIFPSRKIFRIKEVSTSGYVTDYFRWPLFFNKVNDITIDGEGCTIAQDAGAYIVDYNYKPWGGIKLEKCDNIQISNLTFHGGANRLTRNPAQYEMDTHGMMLTGCHGGRIENVVCTHTAAGDGFIVHHFNEVLAGTPTRFCEGLDFVNCVSRGASRNGLSVTGGRNCNFTRCSFVETGKHRYGPHSPGAGVDVESDRHPLDGYPDAPLERTGNLLFEECLIADNASRTFVCGYEKHEDVTLKHCALLGRIGCQSQYETELSSPGMRVFGCMIVGYDIVIGHTNSGTFSGDSTREAHFVGNVFSLRAGGRTTACTGPRVLLDGNRFESRGSGVFIGGIQDSVVRNNTFFRFRQGFNSSNPVLAIFDYCDDTEISGNTFDHDTDGYNVPGPYFGTLYVLTGHTTPDAVNSTLGRGVYISRS